MQQISIESKSTFILNIIALLSIPLGIKISRNCMFNIQIMTSLSFMQFLSKDSLDFFKTDWSILIPFFTGKTLVDIQTFRYIAIIQMSIALISILIHYYTQDILDENYDKKKKESREYSIKSRLRSIFCWNMLVYSLIVFMIPSLFLMCFYFKLMEGGGFTTDEQKIAFVYFIFQLILILYINFNICFIENENCIQDYKIIVD